MIQSTDLMYFLTSYSPLDSSDSSFIVYNNENNELQAHTHYGKIHGDNSNNFSVMAVIPGLNQY